MNHLEKREVLAVLKIAREQSELDWLLFTFRYALRDDPMKCSSLNSTCEQPWRDPTYWTQTGIRVGGILSEIAMLRQSNPVTPSSAASLFPSVSSPSLDLQLQPP